MGSVKRCWVEGVLGRVGGGMVVLVLVVVVLVMVGGGGSRPQRMAHFVNGWLFWQTVFRNGFWCTVILFVLKDLLADLFKFDN